MSRPSQKAAAALFNAARSMSSRSTEHSLLPHPDQLIGQTSSIITDAEAHRIAENSVSLPTSITTTKPPLLPPTALPHPTQLLEQPSSMIRDAEAHRIAENSVSLAEFKIVSADQKISTKGLHYCCAIFLKNQEKVGLAHVWGMNDEGKRTDLSIIRQFFKEFDTIDQITLVMPIINTSSDISGVKNNSESLAINSTDHITEEIAIIKRQNNIKINTECRLYSGLSGRGYEASYDNGKITVQREKSKQREESKISCVML